MRTFRMSFSLALLSLSSSSGAVASSLCDQVQNNLVTNCGFETGDFTGWTLSGNTGNRGGYYYGVDAIDAFSGNYGAYLGPFGAPLDLGENLVTQMGAEYSVGFWLDQDTLPTPGYAHDFSASFGGQTLLSLSNADTTGWILLVVRRCHRKPGR